MPSPLTNPLDGLARVKPEVFWSKVDVRGMDECWPWIARARHQKGYGMVYTQRNGRRTSVTASRVAYALGHGLADFPPSDQEVCHRCDNPPCCNPFHLWLGSPAENSRDSVLKERRGRKLTKADVETILSSGESDVDTAKRFGVSATLVGKIRLGRSWRHLTANRARSQNPRFRGVVLGPVEVREIRSSSAVSRELADLYGVTTSTINRIRSGSSWKNLLP